MLNRHLTLSAVAGALLSACTAKPLPDDVGQASSGQSLPVASSSVAVSSEAQSSMPAAQSSQAASSVPVVSSSEAMSSSSSSEPNITLVIDETTDSLLCGFNGVIEDNHTGFNGAGFLNSDNAVGAGLSVTINSPRPQMLSLSARYALGAADSRPAEVHVNQQHVASFTQTPTNGWTDWQTEALTVALNAGNNEITLKAATASGLANLDELALTALGITAVPCGQSPTRIFIAGDSTVSTYRENNYPMTGWGQVLGQFYQGNVSIFNHAIGGRSSRSFYEQGRWQALVDELQAGDTVMIQFGHNDRDFTKEERYTPTNDYGNYLRMFVADTRAKGAVPILVTPMVLNAYRNGELRNVFTESGNDYAGTMKAVATELNVPLVDLNADSFARIQSVGQNYASQFLFMQLAAGEYPNYPDGINDGTHFRHLGALEMARMIRSAIATNSDARLRPLQQAQKPLYAVSIQSNNAASVQTLSGAWPAGMELPLKAIPASGSSFVAWELKGLRIEANADQWFTLAAPATLTAIYSVSTPVNYPKATVFLIGDSTVSNYTQGYYPQTGWGQVFQQFFDPAKITIDNRALGGRSSKSFYNDHWADVIGDVRAGDFVLIQFGINDRNKADPNRYAPGDGTFQDYLTRFVNETRAKGATPILVSTVVRNAWQDNDTRIYEAYHEHPVITRELAGTLGVGLIDLDGLATNYLEGVGITYSTYFLYMNVLRAEYPNLNGDKADNVHFQEQGALEMARLAASSVRNQAQLPAFAQLAAALTPLYSLTVNAQNASGQYTKNGQYPAGALLTLRYRGNGTARWQSQGNPLRFVMPANNTQVQLQVN